MGVCLCVFVSTRYESTHALFFLCRVSVSPTEVIFQLRQIDEEDKRELFQGPWHEGQRCIVVGLLR